jgi:hypothetical protein
MITKTNNMKFLTLMVIAAGFVLAGGSLSSVLAQQTRDPFDKPNWAKPQDPNAKAKTTTGVEGKPAKPVPPPVVPMVAPAIQDRINYYKNERERAALEGRPLPKVTSVLTLDEMQITGIFRTPRGYAAMIQATPISLSYTIYPGEKFFNGQLVAVEENRLVFRKVIKMSNGKFVSTEENKILRQYTQQEEIQGTAPADTSAANTGTPPAQPAAGPASTPGTAVAGAPAQPVTLISPLEEMNRQPAEKPADEKAKASTKKGKAKTSSAKKPTRTASSKP